MPPYETARAEPASNKKQRPPQPTCTASRSCTVLCPVGEAVSPRELTWPGTTGRAVRENK
uniref:Uncharacterized protein n=1 Tax=Leersia perrieri TaxID=77586 RepID=A0A0D9V7X0_9ORYZ